MNSFIEDSDSAVSIAPPFSLRRKILNAALKKHDAKSALDAYIEQIERLSLLLDGLSNKDWELVVVDEWDVRCVVTHLMVVDGFTLGSILRAETSREFFDVEVATSRAIGELRSESSDAIFAKWREQAGRIIDVVRDEHQDEDEPVSYLELPLTVGQVLIDRAFETWIHTRDIRLALKQGDKLPSVQSLEMMGDLGVRLIPYVLPSEDISSTDLTVRLVLEGEGGGSWLVPSSLGALVGHPTATVSLDIIDYCLLIGGRLQLGDISVSIEGDVTLAKTLLESASLLARI